MIERNRSTPRFSRIPPGAARMALSGTCFRVLIALGSFANSDGKAWPGARTLAREAGLDLRKVPGAIRKLEVAGLLRVERAPGKYSTYHLNYGSDAPLPEQAAHSVAETGNGDCCLDKQRSAREPDQLAVAELSNAPLSEQATPVLPKQATKQPIEQPIEQPIRQTLELVAVEIGQGSAVGGFSEFWSAFPRRVAKGTAERAYRSALKHASGAELLMGARAYAKAVTDRDPRYVKHPATWLNAKCWLDELEPLNAHTNGHRSPIADAVANAIRAADRRDGELVQ